MDMEAPVRLVLEGILAHCTPWQVILYGEKRAFNSQDLKSLDFCIILPETDKVALSRALYLAIDPPVPSNFLLYTCEEWDELTKDFSSYASFICKKGTVLYAQEP